ncbi:MAG: response regulator [Lachnospiraceae bacterium]|nr:response regulator [Lachnospiraceae bacterium]
MNTKDLISQEDINTKDSSLKTIFIVVFISFLLATIVSIYSLSRLAQENTKEIDTMLTYRIYDTIADNMSEPIVVARAMSNSYYLKEMLKNEKNMSEDEAIEQMKEYLNQLKTGLNYETAFVVSEESRRYYTYNGLNKIVDPENDEHDVWYSIFLSSQKVYDLDVDSDEVNKNQWTVFVNSRIEDENGKLLGVCGVGVQMTNLQELFKEAEKEYNVKINMVDSKGLVQVDTDEINIEQAYLDTEVLGDEKSGEYTYTPTGEGDFSVSKYVPDLGWYLVVQSSQTAISDEFIHIIIFNILLFIAVMSMLLFAISKILKKNRKEREERNRLIYQSQRAILASEAKSSFLSSMSHEIRTPINVVLGMNEMILRESNDENILEYSTNIEHAGKTLLDLINSILDFSKIEEGKMEIVPVEYDTKAMINNLVVSVAERARRKGLEFIVEVDKDLPSAMIGDDFRLSQVIQNILTNAVKYTEKGHIRFIIRKENKEKYEEGETGLFVAVEDSGIGIKEEDMGRLFESFERLDEVRNHSIEGTGLGMSIVVGLLKMMGSEIRVNSTYGIGTTFFFEVKQGIADPAPIGEYIEGSVQTLKKPEKEDMNASGASVLVVDDNEMNLKVAANLLKLYDISPELVNSGEECISAMKKKRYDIVFLDHMMPKMDGMQTLEELKKNGLIPGNTAMIVLTANAVKGAKEEYLSAGFDDYLSKPMEVDELRAILIRHLPEELIKKNEGAEIAERTGQTGQTGQKEQKEHPGQTEEKKYTGQNEKAGGSPKECSTDDKSPVAVLKKSGFDVEPAIEYCGGQEDLYIEILEEYVKYYRGNAKKLGDYYSQENWPEYRIIIHAIKSSSKTIGAMDLFERALLLEKAASEENGEYIHAYHDGYIKDYTETVELIENICG